MDAKAKVVAFQYRYINESNLGPWKPCGESMHLEASASDHFETRALVTLTDHEAALAEFREALQHAQERADAWRAKFSGAQSDKQTLLTGLEALAGEWELIAGRPNPVADDYYAGQQYGFRVAFQQLRRTLASAGLEGKVA